MKKSYNKSKFDEKCAAMIKRIVGNQSTVKKEVYKEDDPKMYHRLVQTVVENYDLLVNVIKKCNYMQDDPGMGVVKCFEILDRRLKNTRMRKKFMKAMDGAELRFTRAPSFVRINRLKGGNVEDIETLKPIETPIRDVYRIPNLGSVNCMNAYREGKMIVQNIACCLPAYILNPEENSNVIDTCSAPGNKTSHLSMIMNNTGKIYAFEMDASRTSTLKAQLKKLGVRNTEVIHCDFIESSPDDFKDIRYILCDPSCSGSGIHLSYSVCQERINSLKSFQIKLVQHALKFRPEKLIYSVCSSHKEEGEEVIDELLRDNLDYEIEDISGFWKSDASFDFQFSHKIIRCQKNSEAGTIGFFIALLALKK